MTENIDLKALEKKAYRSYFKDGFWDIFLGLIVLNIGLGLIITLFLNLNEISGFIVTSLVWNIIAFLIFYFGKKRITIPRIGYVKFGEERQAKHSKLTIILVGFFILNVVLLFIPLTGVLDYIQIDHLILTLFLGLGVFTFPLCIVAYFLDYTRLYYYAIIMGIGLFLAELLNPVVGVFLDTGIVYASIGGTILVIGIINLIQFLKKYPLQEEGVE